MRISRIARRKSMLALLGLVACLLGAVALAALKVKLVSVSNGKRDSGQTYAIDVKAERVDDRGYFQVDIRVDDAGSKHLTWARLAIEENEEPILSVPVDVTEEAGRSKIILYITRALAAKSHFSLHFDGEEGPLGWDDKTIVYNIDLSSYLPKEPQQGNQR